MNLDSFHQISLFLPQNLKNSSGKRDRGQALRHMKMYYVANARMPNEKAHGIQLAKQCEAFVAAGIDLELILPRQHNPLSDTIPDFYALGESIPVRTLPVLMLGKSGFAFNLKSLSFSLTSFLYLFCKVQREKAVVYTIDLDQFSFFPLPLLRVPVFFEVHGSKKKSPMLSFFLKRVCGVITNSGGVAAKFRADFGISKEKIMTAPNGIDPKLFPSNLSKQEARKVLGLPFEKSIAVHTGQFYDWKGLGIIAQAAAMLPEILFYMVGGTEEGFRRVTSVQKIPKNVICVGHKRLGDIPAWVAAADSVLVLGTKSNSYSYTETSPMKMFEFLASGRPMVVSGTLANCEIVTEREVCFYEPDNVDAFVEAIKESLHGDDRWKRAAYGKEKAKAYTWEQRTKAILEFITSSEADK